MPIITINGQRGSGAPEIGMEVAKRLQYGYVDRQVLGEAANRLGTTEEVLEEMEVSALTGPRIMRVLSRIMSRMGRVGATSDPFTPFGLGVDYSEMMAEGSIGERQVDDKRFIEATVDVVRDLADAGNAVIVGRASNIILKDHPQAFHVGLVSTIESRIAVVSRREGLSLEDAGAFTERAEQARVEFFRRYFGVTADDPAQFHMVLNTHLLDLNRAVDIVVNSSQMIQ